MDTPNMGTPMSAPKMEGGKPPNPWMIASGILGIALVASLALGGQIGGGKDGEVVGQQKAATDLVDFINKVYGSRVGTAMLTGVTEEHGLYKVTLSVPDQAGKPSEQTVFVSRDGKMFIPAAVDVAQVMAQYEEFQKSAAAGSAGGDLTGSAAAPAPAPAPANTNSTK